MAIVVGKILGTAIISGDVALAAAATGAWMNRLPQVTISKAINPQQNNQPIRRLLIVQQVLKQYRLAFYQQLHTQLAAEGIELTLCFSLPDALQQSKADNITTPPGPYAQLVRIQQFGPLVWQSVPPTQHYDLVIVEQANRHLLNYLLLLQRLFSHKPKLVFWGHGFNHQASAGLWSAIKEQYKKWLLRLPDGFFAYTEAVARYAAAQGVDQKHIIVLNNSIDTSDFAAKVQMFRQQRKSAELANEHSYSSSNSSFNNSFNNSSSSKPAQGLTLLFCGALYPDKKISLLLQTARFLAEKGALKRLIVLGDGPDRHLLEAEHIAQQANQQLPPWLDYRGPCFGDDKAAAYAVADVVLHPGLLGLAVLDAFAAELPVITTHFAGHSPELAYLQSGFNGLLVTETALSQVMLDLSQSPEQLQALALGAAQSASRYSLPAMVSAFTAGVRQMLQVAS
ncbi:MAG: glycosyltransferase family 4 protein [Gammaproteobacteria bacterium]|nr:glycosyltransferase family 4 protein [Gammaproteobacteria bacterium]